MGTPNDEITRKLVGTICKYGNWCKFEGLVTNIWEVTSLNVNSQLGVFSNSLVMFVFYLCLEFGKLVFFFLF